MSETKTRPQPELSDTQIAALRLLTADPQFPWNLRVDTITLRTLESHGLAQRMDTGMSWKITDLGVRHLEALDHGLESPAVHELWLTWITAVHYKPRAEFGESHLHRLPLATTVRSATGHDTTPTILEIISPSSGTLRFSKTPDGRVMVMARSCNLLIRPHTSSAIKLRDPAESELAMADPPEPVAQILARADMSVIHKVDTTRLLHIALRSRGGELRVDWDMDSKIVTLTAESFLELTPAGLSSTISHAVIADNRPFTELW